MPAVGHNVTAERVAHVLNRLAAVVTFNEGKSIADKRAGVVIRQADVDANPNNSIRPKASLVDRPPPA